jgi:hypothetical protein
VDPHEHAAVVARLARIDAELDGLRGARVSAIERGLQTTKLSLEWSRLTRTLRENAAWSARGESPRSCPRGHASRE